MRTPALALAAIPLLFVLTACDPGATPPAPEDPGTDGGAGAPTLELSETDVMGVTAVATASNGAILDVQLVVHAPEPFSADGAADAIATTTAWCEGEIDDQAIADNGFSFTTVEVTATTRSGDWPDDTPLLLLPLPGEGTTIAVDGDLVQTNESTDMNLVSGSVPHCAQPALLLGPGTGRLHLGIASDATADVPFTGWAERLFGANANQPGDAPAVDVTFSDCTVQITDLGGDLGAPTPEWRQEFQDDYCVVGGATGGE